MLPPRLYALDMGRCLIKVNMHEFFSYMTMNYYPNQDISFMNYFLELTKKERTEFAVHDSKLIEYGVVTDEERSHLTEKFTTLGLVCGVDYINQSEPSGKAKNYYLTGSAFKKCLMRAHSLTFFEYYFTLDTIYNHYVAYKNEYSAKLITLKDAKITMLSECITKQKAVQETSSFAQSNPFTGANSAFGQTDNPFASRSRFDSSFRFGQSTPFTGFKTPFGSSFIPKTPQQQAEDKEAKALKRKEAKAIRDGKKISDARIRANASKIKAEQYANEIEEYLNSIKSDYSIFALFDLEVESSVARTSANKAASAAEAANKATSANQASKFAKEAESAEYVASASRKRMDDIKDRLKKFSRSTASEPDSPEIAACKKFEADIFKWFKGKSFDQVVRNIHLFMDIDKVRSILDDLHKHNNTKKAYHELSRLFHPDVIYKHKDLSDFDKFKYTTIMKILNAAKAQEGC